MRELALRDRRIRLATGDISRVPADAIVNAANSDLIGGGGVDGAIHRAGGPSIMDELDRIRGSGCPTGSAVRTGAGRLPAKHVIHAVGPRWKGGLALEPELLASAYRASLRLAEEAGAKHVTFPSISTGVYRFPIELAAGVALDSVATFLKGEAKSVELATFVLFDETTFAAYEAALGRLAAA